MGVIRDDRWQQGCFDAPEGEVVTDLTDATFLKWCDLGHWQIEEAAAIWSGLDPDAHIALLRGRRPSVSTTTQEDTEEYQRNLRAISRAIQTGGLVLRGGRLIPSTFATWIKSNGFPSSDLLLALADKSEKASAESVAQIEAIDPPQGSKKRQARATAWARERNTLLLMLYAMAAEKFGFNPSKHTQAASKIVAAMTTRGIKRSPETVLEKLREGVELAKSNAADEAD